MTLKKRGLSRGLEALLKTESAEVKKPAYKTQALEKNANSSSSLSDSERRADAKDVEISGHFLPAVTEIPGEMTQKKDGVGAFDVKQVAGAQSELILALFEHIRKENLMLLEEAEALKRLIEEFEQLIRRL